VSDAIPIDLGNAPAFREPWQAKAFALVVALHRAGRFGWDEWVRTLAAEIAGRPQRAGEDAEAAYHRQFLAALETIVAEHGLASAESLHDRKRAWRRAYLNTPHGHPVDLAAAGDDDHDHDGHDGHDGHDDHDDDHHHEVTPQTAPIAVSPRRG